MNQPLAIDDVPALLRERGVCFGVLEKRVEAPPLAAQDIDRALRQPVWRDGSTRTAFDVVRPGESLCLVVSDHTRRTAADQVLPPLLAGLAARGVRESDIRLLVASGIHRHPAPAEMERILGPAVYARLRGRIIFHDPDDEDNLVTVGTTTRGHRVRVNRHAVEADRLIALGAANYHYHAGFGGGRKSLVPGLAARDTIAYNHSLTLDPHADRIHPRVAPGILDGNPVAEEMLEGARMCDPDLIVNTVLAPDGSLAGVFCGDLDAAHRAACRRVEELCRLDLRQPADLVIASAGAALNWVQSHKALFNAHRAVRPDGWVILLAPCPEGLGDERFRYWMKRGDVPTLFRELRRSSEVLGQTALSTKTRGARTVLVTGMPKEDAADLGIRIAGDLEDAVRIVLRERDAAGESGKVSFYLMSQAAHLVPFLA